MTDQVEHHLPTTNAIATALKEFREFQVKHDSRIMAILCLDRAALIYSQLKSIGLETDEKLDALFAEALERAKAAPSKPPAVEMRGDVPSSEVPS
jgi:hypothetical protein